jgi:hypothetical protein
VRDGFAVGQINLVSHHRSWLVAMPSLRRRLQTVKAMRITFYKALGSLQRVPIPFVQIRPFINLLSETHLDN